MAAPLAVSVVDCPLHIVGELTEITGIAFTVTVDVTVAELQPAAVPITVYVLVEVGLTEMPGVVSPVLHT